MNIVASSSKFPSNWNCFSDAQDGILYELAEQKDKPAFMGRKLNCSAFFLGCCILQSYQPTPWWLSGKKSTCNMGDLGSIPSQDDHLEKDMATHSRILAWRITWTEGPGGLQSTGSQRVGHN